MASDKAHELAEGILRQRLLVRDFTHDLRADFTWQRLPERPVQTISGDLAMAVDIDSIGDGWVRSPERDTTVSYSAGMARDEADLPEPIKMALERIDLNDGQLNDAIRALLRPYQRLVIIEAEQVASLSEIG